MNNLSQQQCDKLGDITDWITQGPNPTFVDYVDIPCLTGRNISNGRVTYDNADYVSADTYAEYARFQLHANDTLITLKGKGSIGKIGFVTTDKQAIFSRNIGVVRPNTNIDAAYLNAYILSYYGQNMVLRGETGGTGQSTLTCTYIKSLDIPRFNIEKQIGDLIRLSESVLTQANDCYKEAEQYLCDLLKINKLILREDNTSIVLASQSFAKTHRLDAEYYQPKYDELFDKLKTFETKLLSEIVDIKKSIEPGSDAYQTSGIPFIRVADLSMFGLTTTDTYLSRDEYDGVIRPKKDTILLSKDGSVGIAYKIEEDTDVITSGAILHLIIKDDSVKPDYLTLVLNSIVVKMQAERDAGGSVIQHWKPSEIENVVIPILSDDIQKQITENIRESFALRARSQQLLELAKTAVEIAIEQGEDKAMELLTQNM